MAYNLNDKKRLDKLTIKFSHQGWAPWNKELFSDKLIIKVLDTIKKWYEGNDFFEAPNDINNKRNLNHDYNHNHDQNRNNMENNHPGMILIISL